jgi:hypothetical protein
MTPNEVITEVRRLIQDTKTPFRYTDAVLLGFVNQTLKRMVLLRPDLFTTIGDITTVANTVLQDCPVGAVRLVEIFRVKNGGALVEVSRDTLDQTYPDWVNDPADRPVNFMRHVRNPTKFFLYPRPASGVVLEGEYVMPLSDYGIGDTIDLPDAYFTVIVDGVIFLAESVDDEHVNSGRAKLYQDSFVQSLGVSLQSRILTDTEKGGIDSKEVIG